MSLHDFFGVGLIVLGLWLSAVASALAEASRSGIEARTSVRPQRLDQLLDARERARLAARALATMGLLAGVLLLASNLDVTKGILSVLLGIVAVVVAESFARHAPEATAASGLRAVAMADAGLVALRPLILILDEAVRRLTGANLRTGEDEEEAEFRRHIEDSQRRGGLDERGASLVENAVEFGSAEVHEIMTPRIEIDGIVLTGFVHNSNPGFNIAMRDGVDLAALEGPFAGSLFDPTYLLSKADSRDDIFYTMENLIFKGNEAAVARIQLRDTPSASALELIQKQASILSISLL